MRHHSLFVPRDFDVPPYFEIVEPTLACGFDNHRPAWADRPSDADAGAMPLKAWVMGVVIGGQARAVTIPHEEANSGHRPTTDQNHP